MYVLCKKNKIPKLYTLVQLVNFFFGQMSFLELRLVEVIPSQSRDALRMEDVSSLSDITSIAQF